MLNQYNTFLGDPGKVDADINRYRALTPGDIQRAVAKWIDTPNRAVVRFHPDAVEASGECDDVRPLEDAAARRRPAIRCAGCADRQRSPNGLQVFVVERHDLPKVNVRIVSRAGAASDPVDKLGVANLALATIDWARRRARRSRSRTASARSAPSWRPTPGREGAALSFDVLTRNLAPAMDIVSDVVQHPTLPGRRIRRARRSACSTSWRRPTATATALAQRIQPMLAFGPTHPYGRPVAGLKGTVEAITREDLVQFHQARWKPGSTALIIAGDITLADATALATKAFGGWTGGAAPRS